MIMMVMVLEVYNQFVQLMQLRLQQVIAFYLAIAMIIIHLSIRTSHFTSIMMVTDTVSETYNQFVQLMPIRLQQDMLL